MLDVEGYSPYVPLLRKPLSELGKAEARAESRNRIATVGVRVEELDRLATRNDYANTLDGWFEMMCDHLEPSNDDPSRPHHVWYRIAYDISVALGEELIRRSNGELRWKHDAAPKSISYNLNVIVGFSNVLNPHYRVEFFRFVSRQMVQRINKVERAIADTTYSEHFEHLAADL